MSDLQKVKVPLSLVLRFLKFLGYEFSNRRGSEGIHPLQRGKSIDECTKLYDVNSFDNPEKASFSDKYKYQVDCVGSTVVHS